MNDDLNVLDIAAMGGIIATLTGWLPNIAAGVSIVWLLIRIIESDTVQGLIKKLKQ